MKSILLNANTQLVFAQYDKETTETLNQILKRKNDELKSKKSLVSEQDSSTNVHGFIEDIAKLTAHIQVINQLVDRRERAKAYEY